MNSKTFIHIKSKIIPCVLFPAMVGIITGVLIFLFKIASTKIIEISSDIYSFVRNTPSYLPLLLLGAIVIGSISSLLLKYAKECRGGGIPTAIASIRGLIPLKWLQGIFGLFFSSLLTYLVGVPLGNEGPSVQMGTAVGKGSSELIGKNKRAYERYVMTGGACSGFAIATGAPLSGIIFALEEAHRRFSPTIFMVASISVLTGSITQGLLSGFFGIDTTFFDLSIDQVLPFKDMWIAVIIGAVCGILAIIFTQMYKLVRKIDNNKKFNIPFVVKIIIIFFTVAILGFICEDFIGSGHSLIEKILERESLWHIIILALLVRAVLMIFANGEGVSGGVFVPTLAFGAMIAAIIAECFISLNMIDEQYYPILIVVGMISFLSASSRIPLTALAFAAEALCAVTNLLPVAIGVVISYLIAEASNQESYTDTVIETRTKALHANRLAVIIDSHMEVQPGAFAVGMELRDILWPPTCVVLSVNKNHSALHEHSTKIEEGDVLHLHYQTYNTRETLSTLAQILGEQPKDKNARIHFGSKNHIIPLE